MTSRGPSGKLWTLPAGCNFAQQLADGLLRRTRHNPEELGRIRLLLPTRRACRALQSAFLQQTQGRPLLLPRMSPLGDVDEVELSLQLAGFGPAQLDAPPALPSLRRLTLLARLLTKHPDLVDKPYAHAFALAKSLASLLDEMQTAGIAPDALHHLVPDQAGYSAQWDISLRFLQILSTTWPDILAAHAASDPAARRRHLMLRLAEHWQTHPPTHPIIAAGTTGSIPATATLLHTILGLPAGEVILPGLDTVMDDPTWQAVEEGHPQFTLKSLLHQLQIPRNAVAVWPEAELSASDTGRDTLWREVMRPPSTTANWGQAQITADALAGLRLYEADTPEQEAQAIALTLRAALETPGQTATLITPDRTLAARVKAALTRWNILVDDSAGQSLHLTTGGQYLLALLRLAQNPLDKVAVLQLLYNPLYPGGADLARTIDTPACLRQPVPLSAANSPPALLTLWDSMADLTACQNGTHPPRKMWEALLHLAEQCATDVMPLWQGEAGEALASLCAEGLEAADDMPPMTLTDFTDVVDQLLQQSRFRPTLPTGIPRLRILGQIEARLQQSDIMVLGGLNEGIWPATAPADPWLSRQMRSILGLPLPERDLTLSAHDFVAAASAPRVLLTRAKRNGDGTPATPSRWLQRLEAVRTLYALPDVREEAADLHYLTMYLDRPAHVRAIEPPAPTPPLSARPRRYSVSDIALWVNDPYALYAKKILRLPPWDELGADIATREGGNILHTILERFYKALQGKPRLPENAAQMLHQLAADIPPPVGLDAAGLAGWQVTVNRLIQNVIAVQQERMAEGWRSVVLEQASQDVTLGGITLYGRADRIDRHRNGDIAIIDYKARASAYKGADIAAGHYPQLGIEALMAVLGGWGDAAQGTISALDYWYLKARSPDKMVRSAAKDVPDFITATHERLKGLDDTYLQDAAYPYLSQPYGPDLAADEYAYLARVSEWSLNAEKGEEEEDAA